MLTNTRITPRLKLSPLDLTKIIAQKDPQIYFSWLFDAELCKLPYYLFIVFYRRAT